MWSAGLKKVFKGFKFDLKNTWLYYGTIWNNFFFLNKPFLTVGLLLGYFENVL